MQVRTRLRCIVTTIDSNSCLAVMSQTLPLSFNIFLPFSDFHRAPGNDHFFSANTAVIKRMSNHEAYTDELFITAYPHPYWQTAPFLSIASIKNETRSLKIAFMHNTLLCYCESCDEFCQVQYITVIGSVTVLSWTCLFQCSLILVRTTTHKVLFLNVLC